MHVEAPDECGHQGDAGTVQRHLIHPAGEAVQAAHENRVVGHRLREQHLVGIAVCPLALVPALPDDPLARGHPGSRLHDPRHGLLFGFHVIEVHAVERQPELEHMGV